MGNYLFRKVFFGEDKTECEIKSVPVTPPNTPINNVENKEVEIVEKNIEQINKCTMPNSKYFTDVEKVAKVVEEIVEKNEELSKVVETILPDSEKVIKSVENIINDIQEIKLEDNKPIKRSLVFKEPSIDDHIYVGELKRLQSCNILELEQSKELPILVQESILVEEDSEDGAKIKRVNKKRRKYKNKKIIKNVQHKKDNIQKITLDIQVATN